MFSSNRYLLSSEYLFWGVKFPKYLVFLCSYLWLRFYIEQFIAFGMYFLSHKKSIFSHMKSSVWQLMQTLITSGESAEEDWSVARKVWWRLAFWEWGSWYLLAGRAPPFFCSVASLIVLMAKFLGEGTYNSNLRANMVGGRRGDWHLIYVTLQLIT